MLINGKEIGFYYSVWAHCEFADYLLSHKDVSIARAMMQKALIMNEAYVKAGRGGDRLTPEDFEDLPIKAYSEIETALKNQEAEDMGTTIETKTKGKKTENPVK